MDLIGSERGRLDRLAGWLHATPAEAVGLGVLLVGAVAATAVLAWSAVARPGVVPDPATPDPATPGAEAAGVEAAPGDPTGADGADPPGPAPDVGPPADPNAADGHVGPGHVDGHGAGDADVPAGDVTVHVAGAVADPGVVTLAAGARVADAIAAAGGATGAADLARTNLARVLADGEQLLVLEEGEDPPPQAPGGPAPGGPASAGTAAGDGDGGDGTGGDGRIDVNRATAAELETLPGIGPAIAARIVDHRERHGPFREPGDLRDVSGIGEVRFQELADRITVG